MSIARLIRREVALYKSRLLLGLLFLAFSLAVSGCFSFSESNSGVAQVDVDKVDAVQTETTIGSVPRPETQAKSSSQVVTSDKQPADSDLSDEK